MKMKKQLVTLITVVAALLTGIIAFKVSYMLPRVELLGSVSLMQVLLFALAGAAFGFWQPRRSWRWTFWIMSPLLAIVALSLLFAGNFGAFLRKDLPQIVSLLVATGIASALGASLRRRRGN